MDDSRTVSATAAKQHFGELLARAARGPVGIVRHGRVVAYVVPPESVAPPPSGVQAMLRARALQAEKHEARRREQLVFAKNLAPRDRSAALTVVAGWETQQLCSPVYIKAWRALLALPRTALRAKLAQGDDLTRVLLANSPLTPLIARRRRDAA
ncbi:MAG: type II toxin-antitoxin system Phd/YefM family antitoxin [Proteobacteria bacterium]|nr:type II toxin-antitoxin system Phd/YefM family antitoxin [Pseudomonadota bacterium]